MAWKWPGTCPNCRGTKVRIETKIVYLTSPAQFAYECLDCKTAYIGHIQGCTTEKDGPPDAP